MFLHLATQAPRLEDCASMTMESSRLEGSTQPGGRSLCYCIAQHSRSCLIGHASATRESSTLKVSPQHEDKIYVFAHHSVAPFAS